MINLKPRGVALIVFLAFVFAENVPAAPTNAAPIPAARIAIQAENASETMDTDAGVLSGDKITPQIQENLPLLTSEISSTLEEMTNVLSSTPSLENLHGLSRQLTENHHELTDWQHILARDTAALDEALATLATLNQQWTATRGALNKSSPSELSNHIAQVLMKIDDMRGLVEARDDLLLTLQSRVTEQADRVTDALNTIERTRENLLSHLLVRDSPAVWSLGLWSHSTDRLAREGRNSLDRQAKALAAYVQRKESRFILHASLFVFIALLLYWAKSAIQLRSAREPGLKPAAMILEMPIPVALLLSVFISRWIYPQAPNLLWVILWTAALIPAIFVLRKFLDPHLFPVLNLLVVFYFVDRLRAVAISQEVLSRLLFLSEMLAGAVFFALFLRSDHLKVAPDPRHPYPRKTTVLVFRFFLAVFAVSFLADAGGFVGLSNLMGNTLLRSAYFAMMLFALVRIADGLVASALSIPPLGRLGTVRRHNARLHQLTRKALGWAAVAWWLWFVLEALSVRVAFFDELARVWEAQLHLRTVKFNVGDVLLFVLTVWASFLVSRIINFILEEEVYPRVDLAAGLHYSISKVLHYIVLLLGFLIGLAWLGFTMTKLTILAGAFSVGLGFGLQNIVNNFVSGIILLFERPVKVGDVIILADGEGVVKHIGIRASIVRGLNGAEIIVPNSTFISSPVTNWTFSDRRRMVSIPVGLVQGPDAAQVITLLEGVGLANPMVLKDPPPKGLLINFTNTAVNFELRVWTMHAEDWMIVRSDLSVAINAALSARQFVIK